VKNSITENAIIITGVVVLIALILAAIPWIIMLAWNASIVPIFKLPLIGWWEALALFVLSNLLIKSSYGYSRNKK